MTTQGEGKLPASRSSGLVALARVLKANRQARFRKAFTQTHVALGTAIRRIEEIKAQVAARDEVIERLLLERAEILGPMGDV